ncbi:lysine biosynthesis protein LysW [Streptomyces inhibens]|uniref:lysine biosynthesis protein LysW n=1 Tax=Streptomyces inhibens TaxID=2293571 RepID=UPI00402A9922
MVRLLALALLFPGRAAVNSCTAAERSNFGSLGGRMSVAACPECDAQVKIEPDTRVSEIVECGDCRSELEVTSLEPATLTQAPEVEEDWGE